MARHSVTNHGMNIANGDTIYTAGYSYVSANPSGTNTSTTTWGTHPPIPPLPPNTWQTQVPPMQIQYNLVDSAAEMTPEEREGMIEFIENLMFLIQAILDDNDVPNSGGLMDRSEYAVIEATIDLGDTEIIIRPKL
jgi:hypothetical protein